MKRERKQSLLGWGGRLSSMNSTMSPGIELPGIPHGHKSEPEVDNGDRRYIYMHMGHGLRKHYIV